MGYDLDSIFSIEDAGDPNEASPVGGLLPSQVVGIDTDGNGSTDSFAFGMDTNGDGVFDGLDFDGDGMLDAFDGNGDGVMDMFDTNSDGIMDAFDTNGDSMADLFDTDGNGVLDAEDTNGDGIADAFDTNSDSVIDAVDTNTDGFADAFDTDLDGILDTFETAVDTDGDDIADMVTQTVYLDTDDDGIMDTIVIQQDTDGDGIPDGFEPMLLPGGAQAGSDPFQPDDADGVVGEPEEDVQHWEFQGNTNRCAVFSQMFAIEELLGIEVDPDELTQIAEENGWYDNGTPPNCMGKLLEHYGLQTETSNGTIEDIRDCLANDGKVIVGVDSSEIWQGPDHEDMFSPGMQADHAVEVIGIDYSDPDHPMVILNDSGTPNGAGEMVPLDQFMDAWQDSGCLMVEAYN